MKNKLLLSIFRLVPLVLALTGCAHHIAYTPQAAATAQSSLSGARTLATQIEDKAVYYEQH